MKTLQLFLNLMVSVSLILSGAQAQGSYTKEFITYLNSNKDIKSIEEESKAFFTTEEDHRQISYDAVKFKKLTEKWIWRYEVRGDFIDLRMNGKVQFSVKADQDADRSLEINGEKIVYKEGMSYKMYLEQVSKIFQKTYSSTFDSLFFEEAGAFFAPLLAWFVFTPFAAVTRANGRARIARQRGPCSITPMSTPNIDSWCDAGGNRNACISNYTRDHNHRPWSSPNWKMPTGVDRVVRVASNYADYCGRFRNSRCQSFRDVNDCIRQKMRLPARKGPRYWGLNAEAATEICTVARQALTCGPVVAAPACINPEQCGGQAPNGGGFIPQACPKTTRSQQAQVTQLCANGIQDCCSKLQSWGIPLPQVQQIPASQVNQ